MIRLPKLKECECKEMSKDNWMVAFNNFTGLGNTKVLAHNDLLKNMISIYERLCDYPTEERCKFIMDTHNVDMAVCSFGDWESRAFIESDAYRQLFIKMRNFTEQKYVELAAPQPEGGFNVHLEYAIKSTCLTL